VYVNVWVGRIKKKQELVGQLLEILKRRKMAEEAGKWSPRATDSDYLLLVWTKQLIAYYKERPY